MLSSLQFPSASSPSRLCPFTQAAPSPGLPGNLTPWSLEQGLPPRVAHLYQSPYSLPRGPELCGSHCFRLPLLSS